MKQLALIDLPDTLSEARSARAKARKAWEREQHAHGRSVPLYRDYVQATAALLRAETQSGLSVQLHPRKKAV